MKNRLIKFLFFLFGLHRKKRKEQTPPSKFLIVSTTALGDTLWAIPAIKALRQTYPNCYIGVLTSEMGNSILENNPYINDLFTISDPPFFSLLSFLPILRKKELDAVLIFHASQRIIFPFCALLKSPKIIGTKGTMKGLDWILTHAVENQKEHEVERRLKIVSQVGATTQDPTLEFHTTSDDDQKAAKFLEGYDIPPYVPLIGIHPGAKNTFKQWDPKCYIEVAKRLVQHLGCQIIVSGDDEEALLVFEVASRIPGAIPLAGELALSSFGALIKKMSLMICNDTGPMHLAVALKTPVVALFCPTNPKICGPYGAKDAIIIEKMRTCQPCLMKKCEDPFCLLQISPEEVYEKATKLFYARTAQEVGV